MSSVLDVLEELESAGGRLAKERILVREKENQVLQKVFLAANDPYTVFFVNKFTRQVPDPEPRDANRVNSDMVGYLQFLFSLSRRELTGNSARSALESILAHSTAQEQKWMERILLKNLRVGVQDSTLSKVWPDLIPGFSVQLAHVLDVNFNEDQTRIVSINTPLDYPVCLEPKLDGFRLIAIKESGKVSLWTRNGNELDTLPELKDVLAGANYDDIVLDGEIFGSDWSQSASVVLSEKNTKNELLLNYYVFDAIPVNQWKTQECELVYRDRRKQLGSILLGINHDRVQPVLGRDVENEAELIQAYEEYLSEGWEGGMVKHLDGTYDFKRSNSIMKMKPVTTHEGVVVGWYEGKKNTKWEGGFGGFEIMLPNRVVTRVGTGFSDDLKNKIFREDPDTYKWCVAEVEGQLLTDDGKIRFPRFKRFRNPMDVDPAVVALLPKKE